MKTETKKITWILFAFLITCFILILIGIQTGFLTFFDTAIYQAVEGIRSDLFTNFLTIITHIGGTVSLFTIALIAILSLFFFHKRKYAILVTLNLLISSFTYVILKQIIQRPRPLVEERWIEETGFSFPSGHATNNMAFYALAIYLIFKTVKNKVIRNILVILLALFPLLIGFSRIYLRVHYPSDVLAGWILGIALVIFSVKIFYTKIKEER